MHEIKVKTAKRDGIKCIVCTDLSARHGNRECQRTDVDGSSVCGQAMGRREERPRWSWSQTAAAAQKAGLGWAGLGWAGLGWAGLGWAGLGWAVPAGDRQQHITIIT